MVSGCGVVVGKERVWIPVWPSAGGHVVRRALGFGVAAHAWVGGLGLCSCSHGY